MSLYRLSVSVVSRGRNGEPTTRSAPAAAAYQSREPLWDERQRVLRDCTVDRHDLVRSEILLPDGAPMRFLDRETLWNEVEARETRINSQVARAVLVTLPREVPLNDNVELVRDFAARSFVSRGMVADFAVHNKQASDGRDNLHAHILLPTRRITGGVFGEKAREWNTRAMLEGWRATWAEMANRALEVAGSHVRLDHRAMARRVVQVVARAVEVTTQAMREAARRVPVPDLPRQVAALRNDRWLREVLPAGVAKVREVAVGRPPVRASKRSKPMPEAVERPAQKVEPIDVLRERLRPAIRSAAVGVAAAGWSYRDALDDLIADHVLPALQQFPELEPRFGSLEAGLGNALANAVQRLQGEIQRDGKAVGKLVQSDLAVLREKFQLEGTVMSDRVAGSGLTEAEKRQVAAQEARWEKIEKTPEYREMASHLEQQIAGSATGEVGRLDTRGATDVWLSREAARGVPVSERPETTERQDELASRRAHEAQSRSYVLTR